MIYYRVKPEFDQKRRKDGSFLVAHELYTAHEKSRLHIPEAMLEAVNISRKKVYFAFGARFAH